MKIKATSFEILNGINGTKLLLEVDKGSFKAVMKMQENKTLSGDLEVKVEKYREKRSLNHNKFFWDMQGCLRQRIKQMQATRVYKQLIRDFGIATIIPIADDILEMTINAWQEKGRRVANGNVAKKVNLTAITQMLSFGLAVRFIIQSSFINWLKG